MLSLRNKLTDALNEVRTLILGAQIFLGFQLHAVFQPRFGELPAFLQTMNAAAYGLMLGAVICLIAPVSFHRLVERSARDGEIQSYLTGAAATALLPFAFCIGIDQFLVGYQIFGPGMAIVSAVMALLLALGAWYGIELVPRLTTGRLARPRASRRSQSMRTPRREKIRMLGTEIRVVLPGAQALLGFQFSAVLSNAFEDLPITAQAVHYGALSAAAVSVVLLMAPAAYHRIAAGGEDRTDVDLFGVIAMLTAMALLGVALAGDFYIVLGKALGWSLPIAVFAVLSFLLPMVLWFGYPTMKRRGGAAR